MSVPERSQIQGLARAVGDLNKSVSTLSTLAVSKPFLPKQEILMLGHVIEDAQRVLERAVEEKNSEHPSGERVDDVTSDLRTMEASLRERIEALRNKQ